MTEPCKDCKSTENVTLAPDPYYEEITGDDTPVWLCESCRFNSAQDI